MWSCPGAAALWRFVKLWWKDRRGPSIKRELVVKGEGLKDLEKDCRRVVWVVISEAKYILWEWRTTCLKKHLLRVFPERLFCRLLGKIVTEVKMFKECYGDEETRRIWGGLPRVGVG